MPTITQLEYVIAVDSERHFGNAAKKCHVSQPSLSAQIQKIEEEIGQVIFDRSKKPILLTVAGQHFVDQARVVLKEHKRLKEVVDSSSKEPRGVLQLAIIPTLAPYLIPLFLRDFSNNHPKIHLKISVLKTESVISGLLDDSLDAGLLVTPLYDERLIEKHLFYEPFFVYCSADHPLYKKNNLNEKDLDQPGLWLLDEGHCFRNQVLKICKRTRSNQLLPNVEFTSGDLETIVNLIDHAGGFTLLPELAAQRLKTSNQRDQIGGFLNPRPTREVSLVYGRDFLKDAILRALEESIIDHLPPEITSLKRQRVEVIDFN